MLRACLLCQWDSEMWGGSWGGSPIVPVVEMEKKQNHALWRVVLPPYWLLVVVQL